MIRLDAVVVEHRGVRALGPFSLAAEGGEITALVGPSGCGKSTALRLIAGLERPGSGTARTQAAAGEIGFVFQAPTLMPWATALDNAALPLALAGRPDARARAAEALARVGLAGAEAKKPAQLSGGMAMRAALARALAAEPRLLLLDEPFAALDAITRRGLIEDVHRLWSETEPAVVFVTHDTAEAVYLAHRVVVMTRGPGRAAGEVRVDAPVPRPAGFRADPTFLKAVAEVDARLAEAMAAPS